MNYHSWTDLLQKWASGHDDLKPQRTTWAYRVEDALLIWTDLPAHLIQRGVGVPATDTKPRLFYYMITHWRGRMEARAELEATGGMPVMPFEMNGLLDKADRIDLASPDVGEHDYAALDLIRTWVARMGNFDGGVTWRGHRIDCAGKNLMFLRKYRGKYHSIFIAFADDVTDTIRVKGQTGRSEDVAWVRDAVWVAISREMGLAKLPPGLSVERLGMAGCGPHSVTGGKIEIMPTPPYLTKHMEKVGPEYG